MPNERKSNLPTRYANSRPALHRYLADAFRQSTTRIDTWAMETFYAALDPLLSNEHDLSRRSTSRSVILSAIMFRVVKGLSVGYSKNPQNDIVEEVMSALDDFLA